VKKVQILLDVTMVEERADPSTNPYDLMVTLENVAEQQYYVRQAVASIREKG
jgi:hypothetical protein